MDARTSAAGAATPMWASQVPPPPPPVAPSAAPRPSAWDVTAAAQAAGGGAALVGRATQRKRYTHDTKVVCAGVVVGFRDDPGQGLLYTVQWEGEPALEQVRGAARLQRRALR